ncbi:PPR domain-containing protein/PPR_2 domain-containing protein/PPR_3 domain-containing protein [Cephalotus follicularis]|uniref:PPR domain-containing protein/PPR_2 domain-containing protein/PPR_3 domain-containing protein n=1 Tax=Cephalotus follicularis TaxID=3775 RepID=A0A1Q3ANX5_CEPFO|nr:PPR domain-containing protein/PPR_2 domain-containing protein/PPR_3 domain-containing protein [Cephalotus follicularis]
MHPFLNKTCSIHRKSLSYYSHLINHCFSIKSLDLAEVIHAQLIKVGLNGYTFLGNRFIDLYSQFGTVEYACNVFDDISYKNIVSRNIYLNGLLRFGHFDGARSLFDEMPERDIVSWNSMVSGYVSCGYFDQALKLFMEMQNASVRPNGFTFSILMSLVSCAAHSKQIHGSMIRSGVYLSNVVLGNSLINMYGKLGLIDYAFVVFSTMEELDIVTWNSLISACCRLGYVELALNQFCLMRALGYSPDEYTMSTVMTAGSDLQSLDVGKQFFAICLKAGFLSNTIVLSATIDLFSNCNRLEDSVRVFVEQDRWDSALCNSMISSYARHGFGEEALRIFKFTLTKDCRPNEFTLSSVVSSISGFTGEQGSQVHSLVVKLGFESDALVASSLVDMYCNIGLIDPAIKIFTGMGARDLISWNTIILGLTRNGRVVETLDVFEKLLRKGPPPDRITLADVLLACNYGGFVDEGMAIFSSMKEDYGVMPGNEHYACIVDLLCRAGKLREAMNIMETMPYEPGFLIWKSLLRGCAIYGEVNLAEKVAERMTELEPQSSLPYMVLARVYEMCGKWEGVIRLRTTMKQKGEKKLIGCSHVVIKNYVYTFNADQLLHCGGKDIYLVLQLLIWEMEDDGYVNLKHDKLSSDGE